MVWPAVDEGGIPGGGHSEGDGEDGAEAVDDVEAEDEWDMEAGVVDGEMLEAVDLCGVGDEEQRADLIFGDGRLEGAGGGEVEELVELGELLFRGHLLEQTGGALVDGRVVADAGWQGGWRLGGRGERREESAGEQEGKGAGEELDTH